MQCQLPLADDGNGDQLLRAGRAGIAEAGDHAGVRAVALRLAHEPHDLRLGESHVVFALDAVGAVGNADHGQVHAGRGAGLVFLARLLRQLLRIEDGDDDPDIHA